MKNKKLMRFIAMLLSVLLCLQLCTTIVFAKETVDSSEITEESIADEYEPQLVGELTDKRTANEKYFLYDDKTIVAAVYPTAVHYEDEEGTLQDIDNRLTEGDTEYENGKSLWKVKLAKKAKEGKLVRLKYGSHNIVWSLNGAEKTEAVAISLPETEDNEDPLMLAGVSSGVLYEDILENTDLEYYLVGDRIKENLILKSADAPDSFTFVYETGDLEMSLEDNTLFIKDGEDVVLMLDAPVMTDAALEESTDITLSLHEYKATAGNHMYAVTVTPDAEWLAEKERVYPVTVDPVLTTEQTRTAIDDTHAASSAPDQVRSDWTTTKVGMHGTANIYRAFLKFDLPSKLGVGDRVVDASLNLWPNTTYGDLLTMAAQKPVIQAHEVTENWDKDTLTWNNKPTCNENTVIDYDMISGTTNDEVDRRYTWNITELVDKWYTTGNNYGVMLKYNNETSYGSNMVTNFVSSETNVANEEFPCIALRYVNTLGLEDHYTYHSVGVGNAGTAYINDYTGAMTLVTPIAGISSERAPVSLSLVYTPGSNDTSINKLNVGNDFMLNLQAYMDEVQIGGVTKYKYVDGDGTAHYFKQESGKWVDEDGLGYELTIGSTYLTITTKKDDIFEFYKSNGRLYRTADHNKDSNGNRVNYTKLTYSGDYLSSITNGTQTITIDRYTQNNKQHIKFTYPDSDGRDRYALIVLTEFNNHIENIFQYVKVNGVDTEQSRVGFQYSNRAIVSVIDGTFMQAARFSYTTTNDSDPKTRRVTSYNYCPYNGNGTFGTNLYSYTISYDRRSTKYTTTPSAGDTRYELYTFDSLGRTITGQDHNGNAVFQEHGFEGGENNKVTFSSKTQRSVANLALNHNFEKSGTTDWYFVKGASSDNYAIKGTAQSEPTYIGNLGMKVYQHSSSSANRATAKQTVSLKGGKVYTLSAYVKTAFTTVGSDSLAGACIALERLSSPVAQKYTHAILSPSDYTRHSVTVDLTGSGFDANTYYDFSIILGTYKVAGAAYFDCVQLEEGNSVNSYNLIENAGFEQSSISPWTATGADSMDGRVTESARRHSGSIGYQMYGAPKKSKMLTQTVPVKGQEGNAFTAGVWVKTGTVPHKDTDEGGDQQTCALTIEICHTDGSEQYETATIPTASAEWRYICVGAVSKEAFSSVRLHLKYPYNCNVTYFDDACLLMDAFGQTYSYDEESRGNLVSTIDLANNKTNIEYTDDDEIASYTDAKGNTYTNTYKSNDPHLLATTTDPKGLVTSHTYNGYGLPTVVDSESSEGYLMQSKTTHTDDGHFSLSSTDVNNITSEQSVDADTGRVDMTRVPAPASGEYRVTNHYYDELTGERTQTLVGTYDSVSYTQNPINISYDYDRGNLTDIERLAGDTKQMGYHYSYDAYGRVTDVEWSGKNTTKYPLSKITYLPTGVEGSRAYGNDQVISYAYNKANLKTGIFYQENDEADPVQVAGLDYNSNNAPGHSWYLSDAGNKIGTHYFYDLAGRISGMQNDLGYTTDKYLYDVNNNLSSYRSSLKGSLTDLEFTTNYGYNEINAQTDLSMTLRNGYSSGTLKYTYDGLGRLNGKKVSLDSETNNLTTSINYRTFTGTVNGASETLRTNQTTITRIAGTYNGTTVDTEYYNTYYADGSLSRVRTTEGGVRDYTHFVYDGLGQLTKWKNTGTKSTVGSTAVEEYNYTYDNGGNLATANHLLGTANDYTAAYAYDSNMSDLLTSYTKTASNGTVTSREYDYTADNGTLFVNPTSIVHKTNGTQTDVWQMDWEHGRQLSSITINGGTVNYEYNEDGLRTVRQLANGARREYFYNGTQLEYINVINANGVLTCTLRYIYNSSGQAEYIMYIDDAYATSSNQFALYYIHRDTEGKISKLYQVRKKSGSGVAAILEESVIYHYDPYGLLLEIEKPYGDSVGTYNPLVYKDYIWDSETDWYYVQSRYYDPVVGRFVNGDSVISGASGDVRGYNIFVYCFNNPINLSDSSGNWPQWIKSAVKWVAKNVVKPVVKAVQKKLAKTDFTYSTGAGTGGSITGYGFQLQGGLSFDSKGNVAIQGTVAAGFSTEASVSGTVYNSLSNAPDVSALEGSGYQAGGSYGWPIGYVPVMAGGDWNIIPTDNPDKTYYGGTFVTGFGSSGFEGHVDWTFTGTLPGSKINIFEQAEKVYDAIMRW